MAKKAATSKRSPKPKRVPGKVERVNANLDFTGVVRPLTDGQVHQLHAHYGKDLESSGSFGANGFRLSFKSEALAEKHTGDLFCDPNTTIHTMLLDQLDDGYDFIDPALSSLSEKVAGMVDE